MSESRVSFTTGAWFNHGKKRYPFLLSNSSGIGFIPYDALHDEEIAQLTYLGLPRGARGVRLERGVEKSFSFYGDPLGDEMYTQWFLETTDRWGHGEYDAYYKWFRKFVLCYRGTPQLVLEQRSGVHYFIEWRWLLGSKESELHIHRNAPLYKMDEWEATDDER